MPTATRISAPGRAVIAVLLSAVLSLACAEILLRAIGRTPWRDTGRWTNEPTMHAASILHRSLAPLLQHMHC